MITGSSGASGAWDWGWRGVEESRRNADRKIVRKLAEKINFVLRDSVADLLMAAFMVEGPLKDRKIARIHRRIKYTPTFDEMKSTLSLASNFRHTRDYDRSLRSKRFDRLTNLCSYPNAWGSEQSRRTFPSGTSSRNGITPPPF